MPVSQQSGFTFPMIQKGPQGRVNYVHNNSQRLIADSVLQVLMTLPGERLGNPTFGCRVRRIPFEPNADTYVSVIQNLIIEALTLWEPRVTIRSTDITVAFATDNSGQTNITVAYRINNPDFTGNPVSIITITV